MLNEAIVYDDTYKPSIYIENQIERLKSLATIQKIPKPQEKTNYSITDEHLGAGTPKERYRNNIAAIKLLFHWKRKNVMPLLKNRKF